jgi:hypothetical protein
MSDVGPTEPMPASARGGATRAGDDLQVEPRRTTGTGHLPADGTASRAGSRDDRNPVEAAQKPENRAKLLLAIAAMTLLNLLLLLAVLSAVTGDSFETVTVDGASCVLETGGEEGVLYCQR